MMYSLISFLILLLFSFSGQAKVCEPEIIKNKSEIKEKVKICNKGDKILVKFDIKINKDKLILYLCDIRFPLIYRDETKIIHKRNSGESLICIFDPNFD